MTKHSLVTPGLVINGVRFGDIIGSPAGTLFPQYADLNAARVHRPPVAGISARQAYGAESIVLNGGYKDDQDFGDEIIYTGQGGQDASRRQVQDQTWTRGNQGLRVNQAQGLPVRVIRGWKGEEGFAPESGYRYDGLYSVVDSWMAPSSDGPLVCQFRLVRTDRFVIPTAAAASDGGPPDRVPSTVMRVVRDTALAVSVKGLYGYRCQITGNRIDLPGGRTYAEGAHIRPLGKPHDGPDVIGNLLCLSPDAHVKFDNGTWVITDELKTYDTVERQEVGPLRIDKRHEVDLTYIRYHRQLFAS